MRVPRLLAIPVLLLTLVAFPLGALASHQFGDVPDSNPFHADIDALADSGVTTGCGGGNFCPSANVTREQMAAFMNRLGALQQGKTPVVNADKVDGRSSQDLNRVAYNSTPILVDVASAGSGTLSTTITTPGLGYLLIWGSSWVYNSTFSGGDEVACYLQVNNATVAGAYAWQDISFTSTTDDDDDSCGVQGGYVVCAAATYTVDYEIADLGAESQARDSSIMVEYVPFNGSGTTPSCIVVPNPPAPSVEHPTKD